MSDLLFSHPSSRWLKQSCLDTPALAHLKRIRKLDGKTTLLIISHSTSPEKPLLPPDLGLPEPYIVEVPRTAALTQKALKVKTTFWPTIYAPRKKGELEPVTRGRVRWAWNAMQNVIREAAAAKANGEVRRANWVLFYPANVLLAACRRSRTRAV